MLNVLISSAVNVANVSEFRCTGIKGFTVFKKASNDKFIYFKLEYIKQTFSNRTFLQWSIKVFSNKLETIIMHLYKVSRYGRWCKNQSWEDFKEQWITAQQLGSTTPKVAARCRAAVHLCSHRIIYLPWIFAMSFPNVWFARQNLLISLECQHLRNCSNIPITPQPLLDVLSFKGH